MTEKASDDKEDSSSVPAKPPRSGYMLFASERRKGMANSGLRVGETSKVIASEWNGMDGPAKNEWKLTLKQVKEDYDRWMAAHPHLQIGNE